MQVIIRGKSEVPVRLECRLLIKQLPPTIIIHFKRFKYDEKYKSMVKISSKVPFPFDLKIETVIR